MSAEATLPQRLRKMLLENVGLKLFSLMVSIGLFTVVHGSEAESIVAGPPPPDNISRMVSGLMPKIAPPTSAMTIVPMPMLRPPKPNPPPRPPPSPRLSSTLSDSRLPSQRMLCLPCLNAARGAVTVNPW